MAKRFGTIEVLPSGAFRASFTADGQRHRAPMAFPTRADAETYLAAIQADIIRGTWQQGHTAGRETVGAYALAWLAGRTDLRPRTLELYADVLDRFIIPTIGATPLRDLTPARMRAWYADLGRTATATRQAQTYRLTKSILAQAARDGQIPTNPLDIRGAATVRSPERVPPTLAAIEATADAMPARYKALVLVAAFGGFRIAELSGLRREDITIDNDGTASVTVRRILHRIDGQWTVGEPKTAAGRRTVTLPASLAPVIAEHLATYVPPEPGSLLFTTSSRTPVDRSTLGQILHRAQDRAGVPRTRFHDLRHAGATLAAQSGATTKDTMSRLGHSSSAAALRYQHSAQDRDQAIAAALDEARTAALSGNVIPLRRPASA